MINFSTPATIAPLDMAKSGVDAAFDFGELSASVSGLDEGKASLGDLTAEWEKGSAGGFTLSKISAKIGEKTVELGDLKGKFEASVAVEASPLTLSLTGTATLTKTVDAGIKRLPEKDETVDVKGPKHSVQDIS